MEVSSTPTRLPPPSYGMLGAVLEALETPLHTMIPVMLAAGIIIILILAIVLFIVLTIQ